MSLFASLGGLPPALALAIAGAMLTLLAWLGRRRPTWLFLLALAALAIRPELLWGGPEVGWQWGLHQTLLVFALAVNALHFGLRRIVNWPILALLAVFALSSAFGSLHPKLGTAANEGASATFAPRWPAAPNEARPSRRNVAGQHPSAAASGGLIGREP